MYTSINGELCKIDRAYSGEIVILQNEFLKLNSVLGDTKLLPQRKKIENPHPLLQRKYNFMCRRIHVIS